MYEWNKKNIFITSFLKYPPEGAKIAHDYGLQDIVFILVSGGKNQLYLFRILNAFYYLGVFLIYIHDLSYCMMLPWFL